MPKMIADMPFTYDRKDLKQGDDFVATDKDSLALRVYRRAHLAEDVEEAKPTTRGKRAYKRRDMRAEG
jgi:hypothetical protein